MFAAYLSFVCVEFSATLELHIIFQATLQLNRTNVFWFSRQLTDIWKKKHYKNKQQFIYIFCFKERQRKQQNKHTTNTHIDTFPSRPSPTLLTLQNTSYDGHDRSVFAKRFMFRSCSVFGHEKGISLNSFTVNIKCVLMIWSFLLL